MAEDKQRNARTRHERARTGARSRAHAQVTTEPDTVPNPGVVTGQPPSLLVGIHVIPTGPRYLFVDAEGRVTQKQRIVIGAAEDCDIQLPDPTVSAHHCLVVRRRSRVYVEDLGSTNGVWIAGCRAPRCELYPGTVFTIGNTHIAAIGQEDVDHDIVLAASTVSELCRKAVEAYGSTHAAAAGLGVPHSTLRRWLEDE